MDFVQIFKAAWFPYLLVSGWVMGLLHLAYSQGHSILFAVFIFSLAVFVLSLYRSSTFKKNAEAFMIRKFFRSRYDYRELWMKISEKTGGSLNLNEIFRNIADLIVHAMCARQVAVWLASAADDAFYLAYCHDESHPGSKRDFSIRFDALHARSPVPDVLEVPQASKASRNRPFPLRELRILNELDIGYIVPVKKNGQTLGWLGVGRQLTGKTFKLEDKRLLVSIASQLRSLILTYRLSEKLLEARERQSLNCLASSVTHDLKSLATQQSVALENSKNLSDNPEFVQDVFRTFAQTTDRIIHLIAHLSVERDRLVSKQERVKVAEVLKKTRDDLKLSPSTVGPHGGRIRMGSEIDHATRVETELPRYHP